MLVITKCPLLNLDSSRVFTNSKSTTVRFLTIGIFGRSSEFDDLTDDNFRWDRIHQKCKLNRYGNFGKNTIIGINLLSWNKIQNSQLYRKLLEFIPRKLIPNLKWVNFCNSKKAFDGRNVRCLWWPMFRQIRRTLRTFSIQYFRTDVCPKIANLESRRNDFERVTTFIPTNYNSVNDGESNAKF